MSDRDYYRDGFDWTKMVPLCEQSGTVLLKAILASDFKQTVQTDMIDSVKHCKVWEVVAVSPGVETISKGDHILALTAGVDQADPSFPRMGVVDAKDCRLKVERFRPNGE